MAGPSGVPTVIETTSPRCPREPAGGNWSTTTAVLGRVVGGLLGDRGREARLLQRASPPSCAPGRSRRGPLIAPLETKIVTCVPGLTSRPAPGLWPTTSPAGASSSRWTTLPPSSASLRREQRRLVVEADHVGHLDLVRAARDRSAAPVAPVEMSCRRRARCRSPGPRARCRRSGTPARPRSRPPRAARSPASRSGRHVRHRSTIAGPELTVSVIVEPSSTVVARDRVLLEDRVARRVVRAGLDVDVESLGLQELRRDAASWAPTT